MIVTATGRTVHVGKKNLGGAERKKHYVGKANNAVRCIKHVKTHI